MLDDRALNRALLARQGLLERQAVAAAGDGRAAGLVCRRERPLYPYVGLWSRVAGFDPAELEGALTAREAVRLWVMRGTIHLVTAADALAMYPLTRRQHAQSFARNFGKGLAGADPAAVAEAAVELMTAEPRTKRELADLLAERWPEADRDSLGVCVTHLAPCAQVPPRGLFKQPGGVRLAPLEQWLGRELEPEPPLTALVPRYLAAFGPASVADMRIWSRVTGLREAFERLRPQLRTFRDVRGRELFDVPDGAAARPGHAGPAALAAAAGQRTAVARRPLADHRRPGRGPARRADGQPSVDGFHRATGP